MLPGAYNALPEAKHSQISKMHLAKVKEPTLLLPRLTVKSNALI